MRDVPVNVAHIVAGDVFAQFLEIHAAPLEMAQIRADHRVVHEAVRADFDAADGFEQFGQRHLVLLILNRRQAGITCIIDERHPN